MSRWSIGASASGFYRGVSIAASAICFSRSKIPLPICIFRDTPFVLIIYIKTSGAACAILRIDVCRETAAARDGDHVRVEVPLQARGVSAHHSADLVFRYHFLAVECHAYLAPLESHTIYFLKKLINGERKFLHCDKVKYLAVPQYEGLGIKEFLQEAHKYPQVTDYLPEQEDHKRLPRQWVINVVYTLAGKPFADWVLEHVEARNAKVVADKQLAIMMDPDIMRAFQASTHVSSK